MPTPPYDRLRVRRVADGLPVQPDAWQAALRAVDWSLPFDRGGPRRLKAVKIKGREATTVWEVTLRVGDRTLHAVVKVDPLRTLGERLQSAARRSKAWRQWDGARMLDQADLPTSPPLAILRCMSGDQTPCELLVCGALPGRSVLEHVLEGTWPVRAQHAVARAVGQLLARLEHAGLSNRDGKPSNLIVSGGDDPPTIAVIDTVAVQSVRSPSAVRALRDLYVEPRGCGSPPRRAIAMRVLMTYLQSTGGRSPDDERIARRGLWHDAVRAIERIPIAPPRDAPVPPDQVPGSG